MRIVMTSTGPGDYLCGENLRFMVRRFKTRWDTEVFMVHDASWVTDADTRAGYSSPTVAQFNELDAAFQYCRRVESGELNTLPHSSNYEGWPTLRERVEAYLARNVAA